MKPTMVKKTTKARQIKPVVCFTLNDIREALKPFLQEPTNAEVTFSTEIAWSDKGGSGKSKVTGVSKDSSVAGLLMEGLEVVKKRIQINANLKETIKAAEEAEDNSGILPLRLPIFDVDLIRFQVDALIEQRLGGKRKGLRVRWQVQEGQFEHDPYTKKLYRVDN